MVIFLAGRRGSGKTTLARGLQTAGFSWVHAATIAEEHDLVKDELGVYLGVEIPLRDAIEALDGDVVVDGCPRTREQASMINALSEQRPCCVIMLDATEELSGQRMLERGNAAITVQRAHVRWTAVEYPALKTLGHLVLDATRTPEDLLTEVLRRCSNGTRRP
jgi:adenylate kinase family enzyme